MREKLLLALQTRFAGVSDAILSRVAEKLSKTITEETQIETAISGVTTQHLLDSYADSRVGEATQTAISNYEKKHGIKEGKPVQQQQAIIEPPVDPSMPEWAQKLMKQNEDMANKLLKYEKDGNTNALKGKLSEKLKGKVPTSYLGQRTFEIADESQLDAVAKQIEDDYMLVKQEMINSNLVADIPIGSQIKGGTAVKEEVAALSKKF